MTSPTTWPFGALKSLSYDVLDIDPPWPNENRSPKGEKKSSVAQYGKMSFEAIAALPVEQLMARDCLVRLWTTWPLLLHGGDVKRHYVGHDPSLSKPGLCLKRWGLRYSTGGAWLKKTSHGKIAFGPGYVLRSACEPFLIAVLGSPKRAAHVRNCFEGLRREHSRKPEEGFDWLERLVGPHVRKAELFSRASRPGWDTWGYEAGKYDPVVHLNADRPPRIVPLKRVRVTGGGVVVKGAAA